MKIFKEMNMSPFTLSFKEELEEEFREDYFQSSIILFRISVFVGMLYYSVFGFLDAAVMPEIQTQLFAIRFVFVAPLLFIVLASSYLKSFKKWWQLAASILTFFVGLGIIMMTVIARSPVGETYYAGIIIVLIYCGMLIKLRFIWASIAGWLLVLVYGVWTIFFSDLSEKIIIANNFFLVSVHILGMFGSYYLEYYARRNFYLGKLLSREKENVIAINADLELRVMDRTHRLEAEIAERKLVEKEILLAKDRAETVSQAKTIFLANMSHELRTPLVGILGYSGLLINDIDNPEQKEMAEGINRTGIRLLNTLSMVLDLARIESDKHEIHLRSVDIIQIMKEIYDEYKGGATLKGLKFTLDFHSVSCNIDIDIEMLKVILDNIINNAIKFTKKGSVTLKSEIEVRNGISYVLITIQDTGIGIDTKDIPKIFEEFKQLSEGTTKDFPGTGLGLSITKKYVELLQGEILVESNLGKGTQFIIKFPL
ncbi:MAG: HAMP domain-containing histidine kinase [Bacteroidetes bacterium]|nr:HAMP domain-containing histidine kinase [Bacteroidota bacterium]